MKQKNLYVLVGIPGSGKSYWGTDLARRMGYAYISRDAIRFSLLKDDEDYFAHEDEVFNIFCDKINEALTNNTNVIADATHLSEVNRYRLLSNLNLDNVKLTAVKFETPLNVCIERNNKRPGRLAVPISVVCNMHKRITDPKNDTMFYFDTVWYVNSKGEVKRIYTNMNEGDD